MVLASCASNTASTDDDERLVSTKATIENRKLDELLHENELFRAVLDNFPGGISLFDRNLRLVLCNRELKGLLQYPKSMFEYGPPSLEQIFRFNATRGEYGPGNVEELVAQKMKLVNLQRSHVYERTRPNGTVLEVRGAPLANGGFVTTYLDVTHQRAARQVETENANFDKLTSLPKRDFIEKQLWLTLHNMRLDDVACLQCFDLDNFSTFNRENSKVVGDFVLKELATRLSGAIRGFDFIARSGGDRFLVLQSSVKKPSDIAKLAKRMLDEIKKPIQCGDKMVHITASVGIALAPRDGRDVGTLIEKAESMVVNGKKRESRGLVEIPNQW